MGGFNETVGTINTTLRTLLMLVLVGAAGVFGYKGYEIYNQPRQQLAEQQARLQEIGGTLKRTSDDLIASEQKVGKLETEVAEKQAQVERLDLSMRLLKVRRRLARIKVLEQRPLTEEESKELAADDASEQSTDDKPRPKVMTRIEFVEINDQGNPIGEPKQFDIRGDMIYVDYLQVTFSDKFVEEADLDRSTAIALFNRIFGEFQEPVKGHRLDTVGTRPTAYARGTEMSDFERKIWDDFWVISNDEKRAADLGIHAAHGEAVSIRAQAGMSYEIELRASGGMTIVPMPTQTAPLP